MRKRLVFLMALFLPVLVSAQWRVGFNAGYALNRYSVSNDYQYDWKYGQHHGFALGLTGQYDLKNWVGIRVDGNVVQRGYRQYRASQPGVDYTYDNYYLQLPVMASFSFGGKKIRGYANAGVYAGAWVGSLYKGSAMSLIMPSMEDNAELTVVPVEGKYEFQKEKDCRGDFGVVSGWGLEYLVNKNWVVYAEAMLYYSVISTTKNYMANLSPRFNTTLTAQVGFAYRFGQTTNKGLIKNNNSNRIER